MNERELRAYVLASRRASGVPDHLDTVGVETVAALMRTAFEELRDAKVAEEQERQRAS